MRIFLLLIFAASFAVAGPRGTFDALSVQATTEYAATSGATDKLNICRFGFYIRQWRLWNNTVMWLMRSSQNAGTGTTVYSLGGLGTYNGTMVNGPTWGADGIVTNGTSSYVYAPFSKSFSSGNTASLGGVFIAASLPLNAAIASLASTSENSSVLLNVGDTDVTNKSRTLYRGFNGVFGESSSSINGGTFVLGPNITPPATFVTVRGTFPDNSVMNNMTIGALSRTTVTNFFAATFPMVIYVDYSVSSELNARTYALAKSTILQGLGLP